jgi:hypothetical protein
MFKAVFFNYDNHSCYYIYIESTLESRLVEIVYIYIYVILFITRQSCGVTTCFGVGGAVVSTTEHGLCTQPRRHGRFLMSSTLIIGGASIFVMDEP